MREACPCFDNRQSNNEASIAGTKQHAVTETGVDDETLDDDQALHVAGCLDFYERLKQSLVEERSQEIARRAADASNRPIQNIFPVADILELTETYLAVDDKVFSDTIRVGKELQTVRTEATTAGYVDRALINWNRTHAILLDWKFGAWAVEEPRENRQAIAYVLGLFRAYPTLQTVEFYFKLPQLEEVLYGEFKRSEIDSFYLNIQTIVARARKAHQLMLDNDWSLATPRVPACNFCAHIGECPKVAAFACSVGHKFYPLEIPADITPTGLQTGDDASVGIRLSQVLAVWCKAYRQTLSDRVIRGDAPIPPGFKIATRSKREIIDSAKFKEISLRHITTTELAEIAEYTFGKIEQLINDKTPRGEKEAAVKSFQEELVAGGAVEHKTPISFLKGVSTKKVS